MPVSTLDPVAALVVIDLQKGVASLPAVQPLIGPAVANSATLAKAFRAKGLPVVLVNVTGRPPGRADVPGPKSPMPAEAAELLPELEQHPSDLLITKQRWGAFTGTTLHEQLQARNATQIVLTGVATSIGVESTARSAHELGYHVVLVSDAMADLNPDAHAHSLKAIFPRLGEVDTTAAVLAKLV